MKLYILNTGYLETNFGEKNQLPVLAFLIETEQGPILFDTGSNPEAMNGYWPSNYRGMFPLFQMKEERLEEQLKLCGVRPEDIHTVVLSHMHLDHSGNIALFPHADVYVPKEDYDFAVMNVNSSPDPTKHGPYIKAEIEAEVKQYHFIEKDFELVPGVEVITLPGHTPGLLGMVVHLEKGTVIMPQDSIYTKVIYGPPARPSALMYDKGKYFASIEKVRELESRYQADVIFSHDKDHFKTIKKAPEYYE